MTNQLQKMSEKTIELIHENNELQEQTAASKAENDLLKDAEKVYARRNVNHQKVIQMLVGKLQRMFPWFVIVDTNIYYVLETDKMLEIAYDTGIMDDVNTHVFNDLFSSEDYNQVSEVK